MIVLTVDQRDSRRGRDHVEAALVELRENHGTNITRGPERTAGDEFQLVARDAATAITMLLALSRAGTWSIGIGVGSVDTPQPRSVRAGSGPAFIAARDAVTAAKRSAYRCAIRSDASDAGFTDRDAEAIAGLIIGLRDRRNDTGWAVADLLATGLSQRDAAAALDISPSAVSQRIRTAGIASETAATATLVKLLERLDTTEGETRGP